MRGQRLLAVALLLVTVGCTKNYYQNPTGPSAVDDPTPVPVVVHTLEYRVEAVLGFDIQTAQIAYGNTVDGTSALISQVPWIVQEPLPKTTDAGLYVYLSAVAEGSAQVKVQIIYDGRVFREASGFSPSVSGTIRP